MAGEFIIKNGLIVSGSTTISGGITVQSITGSLSGSITAPGATTQVVYNSGGALTASSNFVFSGSNVGIGTTNPGAKLEIRGLQSATKDKLLLLSKFDYGTTSFYQNYSNTFFANGKSLEIELESYPLLQLAVNNTGTDGRVIFPSGSIGIGTTSPSGKFNISNSGAEGLEFWVANTTATNMIQSYNRSTSAWNNLEYKALDHVFYGSSVERVRITSSGNIGIGVTSSAWTTGNNVRAIQMDGGALFVYGSNGVWLGQNMYISGPLGNAYTTTGVASVYLQSGGAHYWRNAPSGTANTALNLTTRMVLDASGSLGIGTSTPNSTLQVSKGGVTFQVTDTDKTASNTFSIYGYTQTSWAIATGNSGSFSGGEKIIITDSGNVGIGVASPSYKLHVNGDLLVTSSIYLTNNLARISSDASGEVGLNYGTAATSTYTLSTYNNTNRTTGLKRDGGGYFSGSVGIGTTSPGATLDVAGSLNTGKSIIRVTNSDTSNYVTIGAGIPTISNAGMNFTLNGTSSMVISSAGNVGIGTTGPDVKFSVTPSTDVSAKIGYAFIGKGTDAGLSGWAVFGNIGAQAANQVALSQSGTGLTVLNAASGQNIRFRIANSDKAIIDSNGNVGIGTTTPSTKLDVIGAMLVNGGTNSTDGIKILASLTGSIFTSGIEFVRTTVVAGSKIQPLRDTVSGGVGLSLLVTANNAAEVAGTYTSALSVLNSGNVGIGTTTPTTKLEVIGTTSNTNGYADGTIQVTGLNPIAFVGPSNLNPSLNRWGFVLREVTDGDFSIRNYRQGTSPLIIKDSGNVGIGTTSPTVPLHVNGNAVLGADDLNIATQRLTISNNTLTNSRGLAFSALDGVQNPRAWIKHVTASGSQRVDFESTYSTGTTLANWCFANGNVGVGTSSPSAPLTFGKSVYAAPTSEDFFRIKIQDLGGINNDVGVGQPATEALAFNTGAAGYTAFLEGTNGERMRIANGGNVGIGLTTPGGRLHIYEAGLSAYKTYTTASAGVIITSYQSQGNPYTKTTDIVAASDSTVPSEMRFFTRTSGSASITERLRIDSAGNVGIGTNTPGNLLTVNGNTRIVTPTQGGLFAYDAATGGSFIWSLTRYTSVNANDLNVNALSGFGVRTGVSTLTNTGHQFYVTSTGNVGIGTTGPGAKLQVKGSGTTSATNALSVQNSGGTDLLTVQDSGDVSIPSLSANGPVKALFGALTSVTGYSGIVTLNTIPPVNFDIQDGIIVNVF